MQVKTGKELIKILNAARITHGLSPDQYVRLQVLGIIHRRGKGGHGLTHGRLKNSMRTRKNLEVLNALEWAMNEGFITAKLVEGPSNKIPTVFYKITVKGASYLASFGRA